jgi:hypothetical protein
VKKCRNDREILQRALAYRYHQSLILKPTNCAWTSFALT